MDGVLDEAAKVGSLARLGGRTDEWEGGGAAYYPAGQSGLWIAGHELGGRYYGFDSLCRVLHALCDKGWLIAMQRKGIATYEEAKKVDWWTDVEMINRCVLS